MRGAIPSRTAGTSSSRNGCTLCQFISRFHKLSRGLNCTRGQNTRLQLKSRRFVVVKMCFCCEITRTCFPTLFGCDLSCAIVPKMPTRASVLVQFRVPIRLVNVCQTLFFVWFKFFCWFCSGRSSVCKHLIVAAKSHLNCWIFLKPKRRVCTNFLLCNFEKVDNNIGRVCFEQICCLQIVKL